MIYRYVISALHIQQRQGEVTISLFFASIEKMSLACEDDLAIVLA